MTAGPTLPILGSRVVLTAVTDDDLDRIVEACSTEQAIAWLETPVPYTRADAEWFVNEFVAGGWRGDHDERVWGIRESLGGPLAGVISLREGAREVGYWLHPDAQGRGLMTDALRTLAGHAEGCLTWPELTWKCIVGNVGSMRVAKAAGFSYLGVRPGLHRGEPCEHHHAVLVASGMPADARPWPPLD